MTHSRNRRTDRTAGKPATINLGYREDNKIRDSIRRVRKGRLSVDERDNSDLLLRLKHADFGRQVATGQLGTRPLIEHLYSVHRSLKSETNINAIKRTLNYGGQDKEISSLYTRAIKNGSNFALLFTRRVQNLDFERYALELNEEQSIVDLGEMGRSQFTLVYSVLACAPGIAADFLEEANFNVVACQTQHFNLVLVYSFLPLPSAETAFDIQNVTVPSPPRGRPALQRPGCFEKLDVMFVGFISFALIAGGLRLC